jgi:hypothetical protein
MNKWEREHASKVDMQQLIFEHGAVKQKPPRQIVTVEVNNQIATCPFCLHQSESSRFIISLKSGFHKKLGKCPECGNLALWLTLHRRWKVKDFALWVYHYSCEGFWQKCRWKQFNGRLRLIGQFDNFWNAYRQFRGDENGQE